MATYEYFLPELGEGIEAGDVIQVLVAVGGGDHEGSGRRRIGDEAPPKCQPVSGIVQAIHVQAGDKAAVGQRIITLETETTPGAQLRSTRESPHAAVPHEAISEQASAPVTEAGTAWQLSLPARSPIQTALPLLLLSQQLAPSAHYDLRRRCQPRPRPLQWRQLRQCAAWHAKSVLTSRRFLVQVRRAYQHGRRQSLRPPSVNES